MVKGFLFGGYFCALIWLVHASSIQKRIIGGRDLVKGGAPWAVSIKCGSPYSRVIRYCGATLISDQWLLTAAHCFFGHPHCRGPRNWHIQLGTPKIKLGLTSSETQSKFDASFFEYMLNLFRAPKKKKKEDEGIKVRASEIVLNPFYYPGELEYDIALIKLRSKVSLKSPHVQVANLPDSDDPDIWPPPGVNCTFVGWGCQRKNDRIRPEGKMVDLTVYEYEKCAKLYDYTADLNPDHEFCAGYYNSNIGICPGDSGGGLIYYHNFKPVVVGIASGTHENEPDSYPGVFTRVSYFLDFIHQTIGARR